MRKNKDMFDEGYLPKLESKTHIVFFKVWRLEVLLGWNSTFVKLKYIKHVILPWFQTEAARYGRDVNIGWLGGMIEISYINKTVSNNTRVPKEIPNDKRDSDSGISLHRRADLLS